MNDTSQGIQPLKILVVDDETIVRESLGGWFEEDGYVVETAESAAEALRKASETTYDVALIDIKMPRMDGLELQTRLRAAQPGLTTIIMTAFASVETAVRALKEGAYDYIVKPFDPDELLHLIQRVEEQRTLQSENQRLKLSLDAAAETAEIVGNSLSMAATVEIIHTVGPTDSTVLIQGESGTGKELVARAIHAVSPRRYNPLVAVHCGALAEGVLESELFGHEKGAFTGASYHHKGKFEQADHGTIFLDEIGDISPRVQVELLRVLEEKRVTRVGGKQSIPVDFRVVAATHRDLTHMVAQGDFREDLYYRLNVVGIRVAPLRERPEDIRPLAEHFLARLCHSMNRRDLRFSPEAMAVLEAHTWPGNARELQNTVERAVVLGKSKTIGVPDLPAYVMPTTPRSPARSLEAVERAHVASVLQQTGWNVSRAATILGVDRSTLYHKIQKYGFERTSSTG
ncbi:MAG: sigma-54-dependent transcriptional regulator [Planctomycetota bacterium]|jgi:DNA-binding NtrC family response regulator